MKYLIAIILLYPAYIIGNFWIDMRIEQLRKPISDNAMEIASQYGIWAYKIEQEKNETELERKRKIRDKKLQEYADKLDRILSMPWLKN